MPSRHSVRRSRWPTRWSAWGRSATWWHRSHPGRRRRWPTRRCGGTCSRGCAHERLVSAWRRPARAVGVRLRWRGPQAGTRLPAHHTRWAETADPRADELWHPDGAPRRSRLVRQRGAVDPAARAEAVLPYALRDAEDQDALVPRSERRGDDHRRTADWREGAVLCRRRDSGAIRADRIRPERRELR